MTQVSGRGISLVIQCKEATKAFFNRPIAFSLCAQLYLQCFNFDCKASFESKTKQTIKSCFARVYKEDNQSAFLFEVLGRNFTRNFLPTKS